MRLRVGFVDLADRRQDFLIISIQEVKASVYLGGYAYMSPPAALSRCEGFLAVSVAVYQGENQTVSRDPTMAQAMQRR